MFIENKYSGWYYQIIRKYQQEVDKIEGEKHHIIPKSLGGNNKKENVVSLPFREHFICHWLLTKMTEGSDKMKMCFALHTMRRKSKFHNRPMVSWQYETCKKTIQPYKRRSVNKGKLTVKDVNGNVFHVEKNDPRYLSGEVKHITLGLRRVWTKEEVDERYKTRRGRKYSSEEYEMRAKTRKPIWNKGIKTGPRSTIRCDKGKKRGPQKNPRKKKHALGLDN